MKTIQFDLQRFNEGGAVASSSAAPSGTNASANQNVTVTDSTGGQGATTNTEAEGRSAWEAVKKQYKQYYDEEVKNQVKRRHSDYKELSKAKAEQDDFLSMMHSRYGTKDLDGLRNAIDADDGFWQDRADEANMTVEQYKEHVKLQRERDTANQRVREMEAEENARKQYESWYEESLKVKEKYPEFDLNTFLQDNTVRAMLTANYSGGFMPTMEQIYELVNRDKVLAAHKASVQKSTIDNIRARGLRPDEAGSDTSGAVDFKKSVSQFTPQERAELARRAMLGETITL